MNRRKATGSIAFVLWFVRGEDWELQISDEVDSGLFSLEQSTNKKDICDHSYFFWRISSSKLLPEYSSADLPVFCRSQIQTDLVEQACAVDQLWKVETWLSWRLYGRFHY